MANAQKTVKYLNKISVPYLANECCGESVFMKTDTFTDQTSLTINHYLGMPNQFHVYLTDGTEFSASVINNSANTITTIDFGGSTLSGKVTYWVKAK